MNETPATPAKKAAPAARPAAQTPEPAELSVKSVMAAINDGADDPDTVDALNKAFYRFGAQDASRELPRSWRRVQRRIGVDPDKLDGFATPDQVNLFANRAGLTVTK